MKIVSFIGIAPIDTLSHCFMEHFTHAQYNTTKGRTKKTKKLRLFHSQTLVREQEKNEQASKDTYTTRTA